MLESLGSLTKDTGFWPTNLANTAALLWHLFHSLGSPSNAVNWAGFYVADTVCLASKPSSASGGSNPDSDGPELLLGPFMGKVACQTIKVGKGVCGTAAETKTTQLVPDVEVFPGHIACDGETKSEIVVPIVRDNICVGVIDIDCMELNGFDEEDQRGLEAIARLLARTCDW